MRKIREILRSNAAGLSARQIAFCSARGRTCFLMAETSKHGEVHCDRSWKPLATTLRISMEPSGCGTIYNWARPHWN
jgi:hypothetical protein